MWLSQADSGCLKKMHESAAVQWQLLKFIREGEEPKMLPLTAGQTPPVGIQTMPWCDTHLNPKLHSDHKAYSVSKSQLTTGYQELYSQKSFISNGYADFANLPPCYWTMLSFKL